VFHRLRGRGPFPLAAILFASLILIGLVACSAAVTPGPAPAETPSPLPVVPTAVDTPTSLPASATPTGASTPLPSSASAAGTPALPPFIQPTRPAVAPGYAELDPATNLHITGTAPDIDPLTYRLEVTGKVDHPLSLTIDDLRRLPKFEERPTLVCPGFFEDTASWAGARLMTVLEMAGLQSDATYLRLTSGDAYWSTVSLEAARSDENLLAYEWEGESLPILHGFPVRAVFPALEGDVWAKWLVKIEVK
jgi:DMSO/TMAO reductase YedYZ molybdopterin-dependent catalytic subunit